MKTSLGSLQAVIFTNSLDLTNSLEVAQKLNALKTISFDGNPTILPIPKDAPLELPRIILRTNDNKFSLQISPIRLDLFYNNDKADKLGTPIGTLQDIENTIVIALQEISVLILGKFSGHIPRLALVINNVIKLKTSSKNYLAENFIKNAALQKTSEMQLNFLINKELGKYKINEWLRFNTLRNQKNLDDDTALLFTLDLNSMSEIDYSFDKDSTKNFFKSCFSLAKSETEQYAHEGKQNG